MDKDNKPYIVVDTDEEVVFTDLDARGFYSNKPLLGVVGTAKVLAGSGLLSFPATLEGSGAIVGMPSIKGDKIITIDDMHIDLLTNTAPEFYTDCKRFDTENNKKVVGVLTNKTRDKLREKRKSKNKLSKNSKRINRS